MARNFLQFKYDFSNLEKKVPKEEFHKPKSIATIKIIDQHGEIYGSEYTW